MEGKEGEIQASDSCMLGRWIGAGGRGRELVFGRGSGASMHGHGVRRYHLSQHSSSIQRPQPHSPRRPSRPRSPLLPLGHAWCGPRLLGHVRPRLPRAPFPTHLQEGAVFFNSSLLFFISFFFYLPSDAFWVFEIMRGFLLWLQDDFVLGKKLGEGAFGVVYKASLANKSSAKVELIIIVVIIIIIIY